MWQGDGAAEGLGLPTSGSNLPVPGPGYVALCPRSAGLRGSHPPPPPRARGPSGCGRRLFPRWVCLPLPQVGAWETKFYKFCCLPHKLTYVIIHHRVNYNVSDPN